MLKLSICFLLISIILFIALLFDALTDLGIAVLLYSFAGFCAITLVRIITRAATKEPSRV